MNALLLPFTNPYPYELSTEYTTILFRMLSHPPAILIPQSFGGPHSGYTLLVRSRRTLLPLPSTARLAGCVQFNEDSEVSLP